MDTDLDDKLKAAAPPVAERTTAVRQALSELIDSTEATARKTPPRRSVRIGVAAFALTAFAGVGTAAAAGLAGHGWWNEPDAVTQHSTDEAGDSCDVTYAPRALHDREHPVSDSERAAALSATADFLRRFDYSAIEGMATDKALESLYAALTDALTKKDLAVEAVSIAVLTDCGGGVDK
jgi:hypothetical protein